MARRSPSKVERTFRTNTLSFFWMTRPALAHLGSRSAIVGFTRALALHLAERGVRVNAVAPCFLVLASDDSSYMTGQVLHPNGGEIING